MITCPRCTAEFEPETTLSDKTIDIGCGGTLRRAAPGYDVYTDIIDKSADFNGNYVRCAMENMPFHNKEFSYARCHHVLEHTDDPDRACSELVRIAQAGIISFPPPQAEIMFGRKDHRWFIFVDRRRLLIVKKRHPSYGVPRRDTGCELNVDFRWEGTFDWQVVL